MPRRPKFSEHQLATVMSLYRAGRPLAECCLAIGLSADKRDRVILASALKYRGLSRTKAQRIARAARLGAELARANGHKPGTAHLRATAKWRDAMVADGKCGTCGKPRERLRYRCDACQLVYNVTAVVYRYRKAGIVITRAQAAKISQPGRRGPKLSKFKEAVARVAQVEVSRPAAVRQAFAAL